MWTEAERVYADGVTPVVLVLVIVEQIVEVARLIVVKIVAVARLVVKTMYRRAENPWYYCYHSEQFLVGIKIQMEENQD